MALAIRWNRSHRVAFIAIFTALITVFDSVPILPGFYSGIWDSWVFMLSSLVGMLLGPLAGAITVGFGSLLGHFIYPREIFEFLFMLGAPLGAACAALIYQRRWQPVLLLYSALLIGYFLTPVSWTLPILGIWDILAGYGFLLLFVLFILRNWWPKATNHDNLLRLFFCAVIGLETDVLLRVFILIPGQTYWLLYGWTPEFLRILWLSAGIITPLKVLLAAIMTVIVGMSLLQLLPWLGLHSTLELEAKKEESAHP